MIQFVRYTIMGVFILNSCYFISQNKFEFPKELKIRELDKPKELGYPWGYAKVFPVGWSKDGKYFAYFNQLETKEEGEQSRFFIFDVELNYLEKLIYKNRGKTYKTAKDLYENNIDSISHWLNMYKISEYNTKSFTPILNSEVKINKEKYNFEFKLVLDDSKNYCNYFSLTVTNKKLGKNTVDEFNSKNNKSAMLYYNKVKLLGVLVGPNSKAIILSDWYTSQWIDSGEDTYLKTTGFDLAKNFK